MKSLKKNLEKLSPLRTLRSYQWDCKNVSKRSVTKKFNLINTHLYYTIQFKLLKRQFKLSTVPMSLESNQSWLKCGSPKKKKNKKGRRRSHRQSTSSLVTSLILLKAKAILVSPHSHSWAAKWDQWDTQWEVECNNSTNQEAVVKEVEETTEATEVVQDIQAWCMDKEDIKCNTRDNLLQVNNSLVKDSHLNKCHPMECKDNIWIQWCNNNKCHQLFNNNHFYRFLKLTWTNCKQSKIQMREETS